MDRHDRGSTGRCPAVTRRGFLALAGVAGVGAVGTGTSGCAPEAAVAGVPALRFAFEGPPETGQGIAANIFQKALEKASGGALTVVQYPSSQLGGEAQLLPKIRAGDIDITISSTANASQIVPPSGVFSLHYLFHDRADVENVVHDDRIKAAYISMVKRNVDGAHPLTLFSLPLRNLYGTEPIHEVGQLAGKKIRVQATSTESVTFGRYGAQTVQMSFTELYTALQTGVVDMAENAIAYYGLNGHQEVCPIMSMTGHEGNLQVLWVSDRTWESLSARQRGWVAEAAAEVNAKQPAADFEAEKKFRKEYAAGGVTFVEDVDTQSFARVSVPLHDELAEELGPDAVRILQHVRRVTGEA